MKFIVAILTKNYKIFIYNFTFMFISMIFICIMVCLSLPHIQHLYDDLYFLYIAIAVQYGVFKKSLYGICLIYDATTPWFIIYIFEIVATYLSMLCLNPKFYLDLNIFQYILLHLFLFVFQIPQFAYFVFAFVGI